MNRIDYFKFTGKTGVKEFWKWCFFVLGVSLVLVGILAVLIAFFGNQIPPSHWYEGTCRILFILLALFWLVVLIPTLAIMSRRLRDAGVCPWWLILPVALCVVSGVMFMDASLASMSAKHPSVPFGWQMLTYSVTALTAFVFICLFCKPSCTK